MVQHHLHFTKTTSLNAVRERSKRQERVGHLVQTELSRIIHSGNIKGQLEFLEDETRKCISVVKADVSPDLRQARISVSIRASPRRQSSSDEDDGSNAVIDKRRAYSWLVQNTKPIRHTLAQKMSHMKTCPNLSFVQVDVGAATDVMYLIEQVSKGYKRQDLTIEELEEEEEDEEWIDEDFF